MHSRRRPLPEVLLHSLWFVALALALSLRFEQPAQRAPSRSAPSVAASLVAASKVATLSATAKTAKVSPAPLLKRSAAPVGGASLPSRLHARAFSEQSSVARDRARPFPLILRVLHRIPRLGAEEPPWSARQV